MIARLRISAAVLLVLALALLALGEERAAATTFCVPTFGPNCPNSGGNVAEADLEKAMNTSGSDGTADTVVIAAGTFKDPQTFMPNGSDPLTVVGAGRPATTLTSDGSGNSYLLALSGRTVTVRDLTLQIPAGFTDGLGAGVQMFGSDVLERVDVVSLNPGSDGVVANGSGNSFRGGRFEGASGGSIFAAFRANGENAKLVVEDAFLDEVSWGVSASAKGADLVARRLSGAVLTYAAQTSAGSVWIENSALRIDAGTGLFLGPNKDPATLVAQHVTLFNTGGSGSALEGKRLAVSAGAAAMTVSNSILRGFSSGYKVENLSGSGSIAIDIDYTNMSPAGTNTFGSVTFGAGNLNADPLLLPDLSLPPGSPSIDAGSPLLGLNADFLGAPRPVDGNGDGAAIRDQGAFEYQRPAPPGGGGDGGGGVAADRTKPTVKGLKGPGKALAAGKAKFTFRSSEKGSKFLCKLDRRKAAGCKSPKSYSGLKPGRHAFKVWAIDAAGNKSAKPGKRAFRVPVADG